MKKETPESSKVSLRTAKKAEVNPFADSLVKQLAEKRGTKLQRVGTSRSEVVLDEETGEVERIERYRTRIVDKDQFVKVYADGVGRSYGLSSSGRKVFKMLMSLVQDHPNVDYIDLVFFDAAQEPWSIPESTFYKGMNELLNAQFIWPSQRPHRFWLNALMLFNGDRITLAQTYVKAGTAAAEALKAEEADQKKLEAPATDTGRDPNTADMFES